MNIILLEFRSGWLSVSFSSIALSSSSKIITNRDFRDLSFERISFLLYLCSNRRSPLGLRELKPEFADLGQQPIWSRSPLGLRELKHRSRGANPQIWQVAARLGCVNWNTPLIIGLRSQPSRSPLGLRELKPSLHAVQTPAWESQPAWAAWIETHLHCKN